MKSFDRHGDAITVRLGPVESILLQTVAPLLDSVGELGEDPAAARLQPAVHREDPDRSAEFLRLSASIIDDGRQADRELFEESLARVADGGSSLTADEAEAWLRTLTTARLVLAARAGIIDDAWEAPLTEGADPRVIALYVLSLLQEDLVDAFTSALDDQEPDDPDTTSNDHEDS